CFLCWNSKHNRLADVFHLFSLFTIFIYIKSTMDFGVDPELSNLLDEKLNEMKEVLNKVHLAVNVINKETKMNLEFWNHHHFVNEYDLIVTTEDARSKALDTIESVVNKNIEKERIKKLDR